MPVPDLIHNHPYYHTNINEKHAADELEKNQFFFHQSSDKEFDFAVSCKLITKGLPDVITMHQHFIVTQEGKVEKKNPQGGHTVVFLNLERCIEWFENKFQGLSKKRDFNALFHDKNRTVPNADQHPASFTLTTKEEIKDESNIHPAALRI